MATHFSGINQEVHNYMTQDVPNSLKSNSSAQAIKTRNRIFQISSTSSSQTSGGLILFQVPPSNYSISRGTACLRARITLTGTGFVTSGWAGATSAGFQGPGAINANFVPTFGNGYSWINRMTLYGANSALIEQRNYLNDDLSLMLMHNSNANYLSGDGLLLAGVGAPFFYTSTTSGFIDVCLPLPLSMFSSSTQDVPGYLLSAPLTLQIDLASIARAIFRGASATVTEYTVSNTFLCYQACELPAAFVEAERMAVKTHPFIMNLTSTMTVQVPASVLTSYTLGLNASSIRACFVLPSNGATYASATQLQYVRDTSDSSTFNGSGTNAIVYVDGNQINSAIFDTPCMVFQGLRNALHHNLQGSVIYSSPAMAPATAGSPITNPYMTNFYAIGWDLSSFDDESSLFAGTAATNVNIQLTGYGSSNPTYLYTVIIVYDVLVCFEQDGTIQIRR
jgi:hypothetical protein